MLSPSCSACFLGLHAECFNRGEDGCCCGGNADLDLFYGDEQFSYELSRSVAMRMQAENPEHEGRMRIADGPQFADRAVEVDRIESTGKVRGDSGYIAAAAWPSTFDIGTLTSVKSAGHKRPRRMYPIKPGQVCDWAGMDNCGGGPAPVLGCLNNPATEWHHGPDKNTLNNEKVSRGIGDSENVHVVCSECHALWHAKNDQFYPKDYDRDRDQARPFIPLPDAPAWSGHDPRPAELDALMEQERRRAQQRIDRGRDKRGRTLKDVDPNLDILDDEGEDDDE